MRDNPPIVNKFSRFAPCAAYDKHGNAKNREVDFFDITYQLAQNEDKNQIFENYASFQVLTPVSKFSGKTANEKFKHSVRYGQICNISRH